MLWIRLVLQNSRVRLPEHADCKKEISFGKTNIMKIVILLPKGYILAIARYKFHPELRQKYHLCVDILFTFRTRTNK